MKIKNKYKKILFNAVFGRYAIDMLNREHILKIHKKLVTNITLTKNEMIEFIEYLTNVMNVVWNNDPSFSLDLSEVISFLNRKLVECFMDI